MHRFILSIFVLAGLFSLSACFPSTDPETIGDPENGRELYLNQTRGNCASCHTLDGNDLPSGPTLQGISDLASRRIKDMSAVYYIKLSMLGPSAYIVEGYQDRMMAYQVAGVADAGSKGDQLFTEEEINNLVAFLLTQ